MFEFFDQMEQNSNFAKTITIALEENGVRYTTDYQIAYMLPSHGEDRPRYAMAVKSNDRVPCPLYLIQLPDNFATMDPITHPTEETICNS
jgi:hypothetical protein